MKIDIGPNKIRIDGFLIFFDSYFKMEYDELGQLDYDSLLKINALCQSKISGSNLAGNSITAFSVLMVAVSICVNFFISMGAASLSHIPFDEINQINTGEWINVLADVILLAMIVFIPLIIQFCYKIYQYKFKRIAHICEAHLRRYEKIGNVSA